MSRAKDNLRKEKMAKRIAAALADGSLTPEDVKYRKEIKNQIKSGKLQRYVFKRDDKDQLLTTKNKRWLQNEKTKEFKAVRGGWDATLISTFTALTKKIPELK